MKKLSGNLTMYICMFVAVFCAMTLKAEAANVTSGTLGNSDGITWTYDADTKTLTLTGDNTLEEMFWLGEDSLSGICMDVKTIVVKDCKVDNCRGMFDGLTSLEKVIFDNFDTSQVTDMRYMFHACSSLSELDVSDFDTGKVTDMTGMFWDCYSLSEVDVSGFDTGKVTNMSYLFCGCVILSEPDISDFDTSQVTDMRYMFCGCENINKLDVSGFDTGKVTDMRGMFFGCRNVVQLDVDGFDTSQVTDMESMFDTCNSIEKLDVSGFDTSQVTNMNYMFCACSSLQELDLNSFDITKVTDKTGMFSSCDSLMKIKAPKTISSECSIELPDMYVDEQGNQTDCLTKAFCNKILYRMGEGQVRAFVERMYTIVLNRAAEEQGLNDWTDRLMAKEIDGATLVDMFVNSDEFINRNTSDEEYIKILYRAVLGREADADGLKMWKDMLADDWTRDYIMEGLVLSTEFKTICDSYGITAAFEPTTESQVRSFVKRMYTVVLNRRADVVGLNEWTQRLMNGTANGAQLADGFISSDEFVNRNLSNEKYVKVLYRAFFNREPDEGGFNVWMNELAKGTSRRDVMKGFVHSVEFSDLCAQYGIIRGEI